MRLKHLPIAFALASFLPGCGDVDQAGGPTDAPAATLVIRGEASYAARIAPPPGAQLEVTLVGASASDPDGPVLASLTIEDAGFPPYAFELRVDAAQLSSAVPRSLRAVLRDRDGREHFAGVTDVEPSQAGDAAVSVRMDASASRAPDAAVATVAHPAATADRAPLRSRYRCGDRIVDVEQVDATVTLRYDDRERILPRARSATGERFAQDGDEFWRRGDGATLTLANELAHCEPSDESTPWEEARSRGVAFWAVGSEPGWLAEVDAGSSPAMRLVVDYGEREIMVAGATTDITGSGTTFSGTGDDATVELRLTDGPCEDAMSGESHPLHARLRIAEVQYEGCGRHLD